ncbi:MAG: class flavin-dependent oxidoreductase [Solirubrobacterales bacterium]|jgi:putative sterol carrier protein|nr:class flavin-dependent oxidoreductase [Solirubrobacterales bacterium]
MASAFQRLASRVENRISRLDDDRLLRILRTPVGQRVLFTGLAARLRPASARGLSATIQFDLRDERTDAGSWTVGLDGVGSARARRRAAGDATATLTLELADLGRMAAGRLDPGVAVISGKLDLAGDYGVLLKLSGLLSRK